MGVANHVFCYAANEQVAQSRAAVSGNHNHIGIFIRRVANLNSWRTVNDSDGISSPGFRAYRVHLLLPRRVRLPQQLSRIEGSVFISERKRVRIDHMNQPQFRIEFASELMCVLKCKL